MQAKKKVYGVLGTVIVLMLLLEVLFAHPHHHRLWNIVPGADIVIGFGGAWLLILLGKVIMNKLLRRPEDYYARQTKTTNAGKKDTGNVFFARRQETISEQKAGGGHE